MRDPEANVRPATYRNDLNTGLASVALTHLAVTHDAPYEELKARVYHKAQIRGLWPKWKGWGEWQLLAGDHPVFTGSLEELDEHLTDRRINSANAA
ncbi:hypothetical protein [Hyphomicrobium sp. NDB2Meth4]|uniref:hypothetical protein n=1 Tax=Hyphomicrobium sp. NDB2Meth4 TaxID=1892846 RepID=UPI000B0C5F97|nr:hypothetical protein [Hyphomicrobium sp. NDB2Meth4]